MSSCYSIYRFSIIQILIDIYNGIFNQAFLKFIIMIIFSLIINILCDLGYNVIAWFLVFIPIIMMTIVSTLLLKVFGLNPNQDDLQQNLKVMSNNDASNNDLLISGPTLLNQQKYINFYNQFNSIERIDRDVKRNNLYTNINSTYDIPDINTVLPNSNFDQNPVTYILANMFINIFGEQMFIDNVKNYKLFRIVFCNYLKNNLSDTSLNNLDDELIEISPGFNITCDFDVSNNDLYDPNNPSNSTIDGELKNNLNYNLPNYYPNNFSNNTFNNISISDLNNSRQKPSVSNSNVTSYTQMYDEEHMLDGYLIYYQSKYNSVKDELTKIDPNVSDDEIDKKISDTNYK